MSAAWVFVPAAVMVSGAVFVDARNRLRWLGFALAAIGFVGIFVTMYIVVTGEEQERAECASRGGIPANGKCWIDGEAR